MPDVIEQIIKLKARRAQLATQVVDLNDIIVNYDVGIRLTTVMMQVQNIAVSHHISLKSAANLLRDILERDLEFAVDLLDAKSSL